MVAERPGVEVAIGSRIAAVLTLGLQALGFAIGTVSFPSSNPTDDS